MEKIDIIIPVYKAHNTLGRALASIACQWGKEDVKVTLVNDACPEGDYQEIINRFLPELDIQELILKNNVGPGDARQYGIDNTNNAYILFLDADDCLASALSLFFLREKLDNNPSLVVVAGQPIEQLSDFTWGEIDPRNAIWLFGKLYRRSFLEREGIHFQKGSRSNEDVGFNNCITLLCKEDESKIATIDVTVYIWMRNIESITRRNNGEYRYTEGITGFVDNLLYAYDFIKKKGLLSSDRYVFYQMASWIVSMYIGYSDALEKKSQYIKQTWEQCQRLYDGCIRNNKEYIPSTCWREAWGDIVKEELSSGRLFWEKEILPVSFNDFLESLDKQQGPVIHSFITDNLK